MLGMHLCDSTQALGETKRWDFVPKPSCRHQRRTTEACELRPREVRGFALAGRLHATFAKGFLEGLRVLSGIRCKLPPNRYLREGMHLGTTLRYVALDLPENRRITAARVILGQVNVSLGNASSVLRCRSDAEHLVESSFVAGDEGAQRERTLVGAAVLRSTRAGCHAVRSVWGRER